MTTMTTAVTEATGIPAGIPTSTVAVLPAVSSGTPAAMLSVWSLVAVLVGLAVAIGWALYARAVRVDRLHRQVLGSRATLEAQLVHRAEAAADLATTRALDPASSLLLSRAAREALDAEGPIVDDGLDTSPRLDAATDAAGVAAGAVRATRSRALIESDLSRVLRTVVSESARCELSEDPLSKPGPGPQVPQHPCQRGPGAQEPAARSGVSPGRARSHAPDLRRRRRHHPRGAADPRRRGATEVNQ